MTMLMSEYYYLKRECIGNSDKLLHNMAQVIIVSYVIDINSLD